MPLQRAPQILEAGKLISRQARSASGVSPRRDLVLVRGEIALLEGEKGLQYLNGETLAYTEQPRELAGASGTILVGSPDCRHHTLGGSRDGTGFADVL